MQRREAQKESSPMKRATFLLVLFVISCSGTPNIHVAPGPAGSIAGVVNSDGVPLPGAAVTVTSSGQPGRVAITGADGRFTFLALPPGTYNVRAELVGLTPVAQRVTVTATLGTALVMNLRVASVSESITVTAASRHDNWLPAPPVMLAKHQGAAASGLVAEPPLEAVDGIREHGFIDTREEATATFAIDVDRASYANIRRYLNHGMVPPPRDVRIEEMVNYFRYSYPQPADDAPFSITTEVAGCPWNLKNRLLRVGIQGRNLEQWQMAPNNLVFLIDVSGSMSPSDRLPLIQRAFRVLVDELRAEDRVAIVVYAGAAGLVLPSTSGADKGTIMAAIDNMQAGGSTAGGAGIQLAYDIAARNFIKDGNNRVILGTDGDFNVGISSIDGMQQLIEEKRKSGVFLSVVGVGQHNDQLMETLADKGNGNYVYLDTLKEAEKVFRHELTGTLVTIAQDVKVQLEFDPNGVMSYRQIGYENRALAKKDFEDDTKDAGELGAGHSVTALFEIVPAPSAPSRIGTLRLRYKAPNGETSQPLVAEMIDEGRSTYEASPDLQFAAAVAALGMLLRDSPNKGNVTYDDVLQLARVSQGIDADGTREEFMKLAKAAREIKR
jgi:Ca-activated chloride channel homolog